MRRLLAVLLIAGLGAAAWLTHTDAAPTDLGSLPEPAPPRALGCALELDRSTAGVLDIGSSVAAAVPIDIVSGGTVDHRETAIDTAGGSRSTLDDLIPGGVAGALLELPTPDAGANVVQIGRGVSASGCTRPGTGTLVMPGLSTRNQESLMVRLVNPYAGDAVVSITSASEAGIDSAGELSSVVVPARSVVSRDVAALLPLRDILSFFVVVQRGAVHAFAVEAGQGDRMMIEGVEPGPEWWVPIPDAAGDGTLVVANPASAPVDLEIDVYGPDGIVPAVRSETVASGSQASIPLTELGDETVGVHVVATGSLAMSLVSAGEGVRVGSPAVSQLSTSWLVPGVTAAASGALWILNPSDVPAEISLQPLAPTTPSVPMTVEPESVRSAAVEPVGSGYAVRSSSPVAVMFVVAGESGVGMARGASVVEFDG